MRAHEGVKFGVVDETHLTFQIPRVCDDGGFDLLEDAFTAAYGVIDNGATEVAIVRCRYNADAGCWYEVGDGLGIYIDASNWEFNEED